MKYRKSLVALSVAMLLLISFSVAALMGRHSSDRVKPGATGDNGNKLGHQSIASDAGLSPDGSSESTNLEGDESVSRKTSGYKGEHVAVGHGRHTLNGGDSFKRAHYDSVDEVSVGGFSHGDGVSMDTVQSGPGKKEGKSGKSWMDAYDPSSVGRMVSAASGSGMVPRDVRTTVPGHGNVGGSGQLPSQGSLTPIPEPETYAMLMAGLGLMGFVVRRRKQKY